jgi:hypothetical protein
MDYHDIKMFELEQVAEERLKRALVAVQRGEILAAGEVQQLSTILANIRQMKAAATQSGL